jgi:hypothetical protein
MHRKFSLSFPFLLAAVVSSTGLLSGCASMAGSAGVNWSAMNPGPVPDYESAKQQAQAAIKRSLKDPDSAQFRDATPIFKTLYNYGFGAVGNYEPLWAICLEVNAKNSYGGYNGFKYWYVKFRNGRPVQGDLGVNIGEYECQNGPANAARLARS